MADSTATTTATVGVPSTPTATQTYEPNFLGTFGIIPVFIVIFYFFIIKPQNDKEKKRKAQIEGLKKGAHVRTSGGIFGQVVDVKDTFLVIKIAKDVKVEVGKNAVFPVAAEKE